ncbi:MAG: hypothetical protein U0Z17_02900 [Bacteroidales bacterium]
MLAGLNLNDIETIDVLKDASSKLFMVRRQLMELFLLPLKR